MTIGEIIDRHYAELAEGCHCDKVISHAKTECDILQDVCVTALRKYKEKEIEEEEGLAYLRKTLYTEKHFQRKRIVSEIVSYTDNLEDLGV